MPETIWLTAQAKATELQARLDAQPEGASVDFAPRREYPGPVVLNKALLLEGGGATLWALVGPVLTVRAAVRLRNLRIEVTGDAPTADAAACAIIVAPGGHLTLEECGSARPGAGVAAGRGGLALPAWSGTGRHRAGRGASLAAIPARAGRLQDRIAHFGLEGDTERVARRRQRSSGAHRLSAARFSDRWPSAAQHGGVAAPDRGHGVCR